MPPPSLSTSTIASGSPSRRRGQQPAGVVQQRDVADQQRTPGPARPRRRRTRVETVPSMPLAPRLDSTRGGRGARREERLDVADRHRGGDDERRVRRQPHAQLGGDARLAAGRRGRRATPAIAPAAARSGPVHASSQPWRAACAARRTASASSTARGSARDQGRRPAPAGSCQAFSGSKAICSVRVVQAREPLAQRLGRRQVADAQHERRGTRAAPERGVAQQRVVVRDGGRPAAGAGRAARPAAARRRCSANAASAAPSRGSRSARPATSSARGRALELVGERVEHRGRGP